jgi:hypothetical protein
VACLHSVAAWLEKTETDSRPPTGIVTVKRGRSLLLLY